MAVTARKEASYRCWDPWVPKGRGVLLGGCQGRELTPLGCSDVLLTCWKHWSSCFVRPLRVTRWERLLKSSWPWTAYLPACNGEEGGGFFPPPEISEKQIYQKAIS